MKNEDPNYEELPESAILQDGDQYYHESSREWVNQRGHSGQRAMTSYRWRRKRTTPPEAVHFL